MWNSANYWVSMQGNSIAPAKLSYDLTNHKKWEFVLLDNTSVMADDADDLDIGGLEEKKEQVSGPQPSRSSSRSAPPTNELLMSYE